MKYKMLIAIITIAILVTGGILEEYYTNKIFKEFSEQLEAIINTPNEEYDLNQVIETHKWWQKKHKYLELFLPHIQLNEIEITYGELIGAVETEDYDSATALLNRLHSTSEALGEMFGFRAGNIF